MTTQSIYRTWREQYERMLRSHAKLKQVTSGQHNIGSDDARDAMMHFFQDAYHVKDWLKNDPNVSVDSEAAVRASVVLEVCADQANGGKHMALNHLARHGAAPTAQNVAIMIGVGSAHSWPIEAADGTTWDADKLADDVIATWNAFLKANGLL
jgi:hypothetical protein